MLFLCLFAKKITKIKLYYNVFNLFNLSIGLFKNLCYSRNMTPKNTTKQVKNIFGYKATPSKKRFILKLFTLGQSPVHLSLDSIDAKNKLDEINDALADGYFRINLESGVYNVPYALLNKIRCELKFFIKDSVCNSNSGSTAESSLDDGDSAPITTKNNRTSSVVSTTVI